MIKLIALDMDGTLLNSRKEVAEAQKKALKEAGDGGIKVVLCTGRPLFGVIPIYETLGLDNREGYVIVNNGCSVHTTEGWEISDYVQMSAEDIKYLYSLTEGYELNLTLFDENHYFCIGKPNSYTQKDADLVYVDITEISLSEAVSGKHTMFQSMYVGAPEELDRFQEQYSKIIEKKYSGVRSQTYIYETMPYGTEKGSALKKLAEKLGIRREEVMAIGDGNNDIEMLKYAGISIAMQNSTKEVLEAAEFITDTNENDGVAKAIYKYALKKQ